MLNYLKYMIEFLQPARTLRGEHFFTTGLTGIVGPNGKGKSMNLEMIQFALHGTEALRGKMEGYGKIEVALIFELKGEKFSVTRTKTNAKLQKVLATGNLDLASGTKPVNAKIEELFGYSSDVFRVANVCNQGKIEELGDMKPTARKRLVDETIGLNMLDDLTVFIDDERKRLNTGIKAIEGILVAPVEPVKPDLAESATFYRDFRDSLIDVRDKRNIVAGAAAKILLAPPVVTLEHDDAKLEEYSALWQRRLDLTTEYGVLDAQKKKLPAAIENLVTTLEADDDKLAEYNAQYQQAQDLQTEYNINERGLTKYKWVDPVLTKEEIAAYSARNTLVDRWEARQKLIAKRVPHDCPACKHHWDDEDPRIKTDYADLPEEKPQRQYSDSELAHHLRETDAKAAATPIMLHMEELKKRIEALGPKTLVDSIHRIQITRQKVADSKAEVVLRERRAELDKRLTELMVEFEATPDHKVRINAINQTRIAVHKYETQLEAYNTAMVEKENAARQLATFSPTLDSDILTADNLYTLAVTYETQLASYTTAKLAYDKAAASLEGLRAELLDWSNGRDAVVDLRAKVKGYLLPSLNSVASGLINQMTGGELTWVVVNDQFEITVEGQAIETLSGAGKAVANLALRIGLGQVLTNRVFSVMMLDEIDAACDVDRTKYIAGCLMNLTKTIKQVIQVSHKQGLPADQYVRL